MPPRSADDPELEDPRSCADPAEWGALGLAEQAVTPPKPPDPEEADPWDS
jgi:hypothetical protein